MPQLEQIIESLQANRGQNNGRGGKLLHVVTITDDLGNVVCTNKSAADMEAQHGSVEEYFNHLFRTGLTSIAVQIRKANGSSYLNQGPPKILSFRAKNEPVAPLLQQPTPTTEAPAHNPFPVVGLSGTGLNQAQVLFNSMDYPNVVKERDILRAENIALKEKVEDLRFKALETQYDAAKAASSKESLNGILDLAAPLLTQFMAAKMGGGAPAPPGLGSPAGTEAYTEIKTNMIQAVIATNDNLLQFLFATLNGINNNLQFGEELLQLLQKHKLIQPQPHG